MLLCAFSGIACLVPLFTLCIFRRASLCLNERFVAWRLRRPSELRDDKSTSESERAWGKPSESREGEGDLDESPLGCELRICWGKCFSMGSSDVCENFFFDAWYWVVGELSLIWADICDVESSALSAPSVPSEEEEDEEEEESD